MEYNTDYITVSYALMQAFMINAGANILDVSYSLQDRRITIQVVLVEGTKLSDHSKGKIDSGLPEYEINLKEIFITKEKFNETKGEWLPKYYTWMTYLLFSKAEVL